MSASKNCSELELGLPLGISIEFSSILACTCSVTTTKCLQYNTFRLFLVVSSNPALPSPIALELTVASQVKVIVCSASKVVFLESSSTQPLDKCHLSVLDFFSRFLLRPLHPSTLLQGAPLKRLRQSFLKKTIQYIRITGLVQTLRWLILCRKDQKERSLVCEF